MKSKYFFIALLALLLLAATCKQQVTPPVVQPAAQEESQDMTADQMSGEGITEGEIMSSHGIYVDYSPDTVAAKQKAGFKVVLFFYATWCPECRAADAAFRAHPEAIPSGVAVLKTDYDTEKELKKKYIVTYQHTFVQIDNNGNMVTKWNSEDIDNLKANIQ